MLLHILWPTLVLAQPPKVGIVTTLQGQATVVRAGLPEPIALKFKDDVFLRDRIDTREKSVVRVLLGGNALATIHELSTFTITEEPGRAVVELETGKLALGVARQPLRAGEAIEVRTPNAIATVRGSAGVIRTGIRAGLPFTEVGVLEGVFRVARREDPTAPVEVGPNEFVDVVGRALGVGRALTTAEIRAFHRDARAGKPKEQSEKPPELVTQKISEEQSQTAAQLAAFLGEHLKKEDRRDLFVRIEPKSEPLDPCKVNPAVCQDPPDILISGSKTLAADETLFTFQSDATVSGTPAAILVSNATVVQSGSGNLFRTAPGVNVISKTRFLDVLNATIAGGNLLQLSSTLTTPGPLLNLTNTNLTLTGAVARLLNRSALTVTSGPAIKVRGGSLTAAALAITDGTGNVINLTGPLLDLANTSVTLGAITKEVPVTNLDTESFALALNEPFIKVVSSVLTLTGVGLPLVKKGENVTPIPAEQGVALITTGTTEKPSTINLKGSLLGMTAVASPATQALVQLDNTAINQAGTAAPLIQVESAGLVSTMAGPMLAVSNGAINTSGSVLAFRNGSLTSSTTRDFVVFEGSTITSVDDFARIENFVLDVAGRFLNLRNTALTLAGPLLSASSSVLKNGAPASNVVSFIFVGDSADLKSTGTAPLLSFKSTSLDSSGELLSLRRSSSATVPTRLTLSGPLFSATTGSSFNTTSLGFGATFGTAASICCPGFFVSQGAQLTSSTTSALIQLANSTFNAGPDAQSGGDVVRIADSFRGAPASELVAPASVSLAGPLGTPAGPLLSATDSTISALLSLVSVIRSSLTSNSTGPLIQLRGTTGTFGGTNPIIGSTPFSLLFTLASADVSGTAASPASLSLAGPLLSAADSTLTMAAGLVLVFNGATLTSQTPSPLIQLTNTSLTTGTVVIPGRLLNVNGTGGAGGTAFASMTLSGPLLSAQGTLDLKGGVAEIFVGGQLTVTGSTPPFVSITGGTHSIASASGTAMFQLAGRSTATVTEVVDGVPLTLGIDIPLKGGPAEGGRLARVLFETSGATVSGQKFLTIDSALLEASAPLQSLKAGSNFTTTAGGIDLSLRAKVTSLGPLIVLDASTKTVSSGPVINVAGGSFLKVTGDLIQLTNGSTLNLSNGPVLNVSAGSVVNISGALVAFGGAAGNTINITNNLCSLSCSLIGGIPVALTGGALLSNVGITSPIKNSALGAIKPSLNPVGGAAVIVVNGAASKVIISGL